MTKWHEIRHTVTLLNTIDVKCKAVPEESVITASFKAYSYMYLKTFLSFEI